MRFFVVSFHLPELEGTAAGRVLRATTEGLLAEGHQVRVHSWRWSPPSEPLPDWCTWSAPAVPSRVRSRLRSLRRPRWEAAALGVDVGDEVVAVADEFLSYAAIAGARQRVLTVHYLTKLDAAALGRSPTPAERQDARAERRAARAAGLVLGYSPRVAAAAAMPGRSVPMAIDAPAAVVAPVERPVAVNVADWRWPPNRWALDRLLRDWPGVRAQVSGAELVLAGRGLEAVGAISGVARARPGGERSADVLASGAVLAFPCPPTSGPKTKVLEAMAHGLPVVTTPPGVEGIIDGEAAAFVAGEASFAGALVAALRDPAGRAQVAAAGRSTVDAHHAPRAAARARVEAITAATPF